MLKRIYPYVWTEDTVRAHDAAIRQCLGKPMVARTSIDRMADHPWRHPKTLPNNPGPPMPWTGLRPKCNDNLRKAAVLLRFMSVSPRFMPRHVRVGPDGNGDIEDDDVQG